MAGFIMCVHTVTRERAAMMLAARHDGYDAFGVRDLTDALQLAERNGPPAAILLGDIPARTRKSFLRSREREQRLAGAPLVYVPSAVVQAWLSARDIGPPEVEALRKTLRDAVRGFLENA
jgi:hypothetical protein